MKLKEIGEFGLIGRLKKDPESGRVIKGIGDDCAAVKDGNKILLYTADMMVEGSHFIKAWHPPEKLGRKLICSNLSDIAAMGGTPEYALISLGAPPDEDVEYIEGIYRGIYGMAGRYGIDVIGGDTVESPLLILSMTMSGIIDENNISLRSDAKIGDYILVSGPLGGSKAGLELLKNGYDSPKGAIEKHLDPGCRTDISRKIAPFINAMIDISDGLASDLRHICEESGVGAIIEKDKIPIDEDTRRAAEILNSDPYDFALHGGEDYELLFTVSEENLDKVRGYGTVIGRIAGKAVGIKMRDEDGKLVEIKDGYEHFRE